MALKPDNIMRSPWLHECKPFHMVDNLYYVGNRKVSSHLFDTGEGLLLLDTGFPCSEYLLFESIRDMGFDPHDIRWILHSHGHYDHFGATRAMVEKFGCKTYLPEADLPLMTTRSELNYCVNAGLCYEPPYDTSFETDVAVKPGDVLTFGNTKVEVFNAAGHTPGTVCYRFTLPGGLKAAMHGGIGLNTLASSYAEKHGLGNTWREAYLASLHRLKGLEVDVVLGNHPYQTNTFDKLARSTAEHNAFIDPTEWDCFLAKTEAKYLEMIQNDPI